MDARKTMGVSRTVNNGEGQYPEEKIVYVSPVTEDCKDTIYNLLFKQYDEVKE